MHRLVPMAVDIRIALSLLRARTFVGHYIVIAGRKFAGVYPWIARIVEEITQQPRFFEHLVGDSVFGHPAKVRAPSDERAYGRNRGRQSSESAEPFTRARPINVAGE